jgi:hypothetical protein
MAQVLSALTIVGTITCVLIGVRALLVSLRRAGEFSLSSRRLASSLTVAFLLALQHVRSSMVADGSYADPAGLQAASHVLMLAFGHCLAWWLLTLYRDGVIRFVPVERPAQTPLGDETLE